VVNHRDGGRDPTELVSTVQPANTAQPVEATPATIIPPSRLWAAHCEVKRLNSLDSLIT